MSNTHTTQHGLNWCPLAPDERLATLKLPKPGTPLTAEDAQRLATDYAWRGIGHVAPNPLVGAVIVDAEGRFLAAGAHEKLGCNHAEINAIEAAHNLGLAEHLRGSSLYVTLEPCAHAGKTPACAPRVAEAGITNVIFGSLDPNPRVNGQGEALLRQAGLACHLEPAWQPSCHELAEFFLHGQRQQRPFVGLKAAMSLDAAIARPGDQRAWITGARARQYGHFLRQHYDAVAIGRGTLQADDPLLTPRDAILPDAIKRRVPWRVVIDPNLTAWRTRPAQNWKLFSNSPECNSPGRNSSEGVVWIAEATAWQAYPQAERELAANGAQTIAIPRLSDRRPSDQSHTIPAAVILSELMKLGITSLLLEGGVGLYAPFLEAGLVDKLHLFQAPKVFGGKTLTLTSGTSPLTAAACGPVQITPLGEDWLIETKLAFAKDARR